jgi:hypothetical protein
LAQDRPDLAFATKELCRRMAAPRCGDLKALHRLIRYLAKERRVVYEFPWQDDVRVVRTFVDTDYAGCTVSRRSTSGGCALRGVHLLKHWATTQKVVTLSSAEAELTGIVKGAGEALGLKSLAGDLGIDLSLEVHADSAAAIGICRRAGIGRVRHLAVGQLWAQERLRMKDFRLFKVKGQENPADVLTKHLGRDILDGHLVRMGTARWPGRPKAAPQISCV